MFRHLSLKILIALTAVFFSHGTILAHDGHGLSTVTAPKGGVIRNTKDFYLELVRHENHLRVFVYDHDLKPLDVSKYTASFAATLPKKTPEKLKPEVKADHWELTFDAKGAHRYTLSVTASNNGHDNKAEWVVEPRKK